MKILDGILVFVSIIAFIGAIIAAYVFLQVGSALSSLASDTTGQIAGVQESVDMFNTILAVGWIWIIAVILSSAYAIWAGMQRIRKKTK